MIREIKSKLLNSKNLRNSYWIIAGQVIQMLLAFVVGVLSARYLGPSNFGTLNYTASFISFFSSVAALSMESVVILKIIAKPELEEWYLGSAIVYRLIAGVFSTVAIVVLIAILNKGDSLKIVLALLQSGQLLFKSFAILDMWFQKRLASKYVSLAKIISYVIVSGYKFFLLITAKSIIWFAISNSLSDILVAVVLIIFYYSQGGRRLKVKIRYGNEILSESYHFIFADVMAAVYIYLDRIMIGKMLTDADVGIYSVAVTISSIWSFVPMALITSFRPMIMELKTKGDGVAYRKRLGQVLTAVIWLCILFAILISIMSGVIINVLYGTAYCGARISLIVLSWSQCFGLISVARSIWIVCENLNAYVKKYTLVGVTINMVLNFVVIPVLGINGAAIATLITEFVVCFIGPALFKDTREIVKIMLSALFFKTLQRK